MNLITCLCISSLGLDPPPLCQSPIHFLISYLMLRNYTHCLVFLRVCISCPSCFGAIFWKAKGVASWKTFCFSFTCLSISEVIFFIFATIFNGIICSNPLPILKIVLAFPYWFTKTSLLRTLIVLLLTWTY